MSMPSSARQIEAQQSDPTQQHVHPEQLPLELGAWSRDELVAGLQAALSRAVSHDMQQKSRKLELRCEKQSASLN